MEHLQKNHDLFHRTCNEITEKYPDKYVIIANGAVEGGFDKEIDAYIAGCQLFGVGNFILKHCDITNNKLMQTFNNRVIFS